MQAVDPSSSRSLAKQRHRGKGVTEVGTEGVMENSPSGIPVTFTSLQLHGISMGSKHEILSVQQPSAGLYGAECLH